MSSHTTPDDEWKEQLTPGQFYVMREKGTEAPGTGKYVNFDEQGMYTCVACGTQLFTSDAKYESTMPGLIGWPAFSDVVKNDAITLQPDKSLGMSRTEVLCASCGGHLGHLFDDPSSPNGQHYCINSVSLEFNTKK